MWKFLCLAGFAALVLGGCASDPASDISHLRVGMDKGAALETAGSPKFTFRENSEDNWMYEFYRDHRYWRQKVVFKNGKIVEIAKPFSAEKWLRDAKNAKSLEEYERRVREHQKKSRGHFENIDGQSGGSSSP